MPNLEQLYGGQLRAPLATKIGSGSVQWAGRTELASNAASVVVSTSAINSDSLVFALVEAGTDQTSGIAQPIEVRSIVSGSEFTLMTADGQAQADRAATIMWMIIKGS